MIKVGIDKIAFYTSHYALDLACLAAARGIDPDKYYVGLGQYKMSVPPPDEDVVTMAANAGARALEGVDLDSIEMVLFATESGVDQSKSAGIYVHHLLGLSERCRVVELKQACYSATAALQLALPFLRENPDKRILLIASDVARYGLKTPGESSQGCGAVAMVLAANPSIIAFDSEYGVVTENVMDFWRPNYSDSAFVDGKYSSKLYLNMLEKAWQQYLARSGRNFTDHDYFCYHAPVPRLVEKAHRHLAKVNGIVIDALEQHTNPFLEYARIVGNSYTAALYIGLISLLEFEKSDLSHKRLGFYSYGSGCVAEYFSGVVQPGYQQQLRAAQNLAALTERKTLTYDEYESFYLFSYPEDGSDCKIPQHRTGLFRLNSIKDHKRHYEKVT